MCRSKIEKPVVGLVRNCITLQRQSHSRCLTVFGVRHKLWTVTTFNTADL